jgi:hypothetical protein
MQNMISTAEIVNAFMEALEAKEFTRAGGYLADSMIITGLTPAPLSKNHFLIVVSQLAEGFPTLAYHFHAVKDPSETPEGSLVRGTVQITGTQVNIFELPPLGIGPIPETAGSVSLPEENWDFEVKNGLIASIQVDHRPGGGIEGLLNQLGIHDPIEQ